ncbi:MAG: NAD-binding protein [Mangrovibacterium sp.]
MRIEFMNIHFAGHAAATGVAGIYLILLICCYLLFFRRRHNGFMKFVKYVLLPVTVAGGWIVYFIGYNYCEPEEFLTNGLLAIFSTARLFILGNDLVEIHHCVEGNSVFMLWFSVIGASAVFISVSILLSLFGKKLITRFKIWIDRSEESDIFFGINEASLSLAEDILNSNSSRLVIFIQNIDDQEQGGLYHQAEEAGALLVSRKSFLESLSLEQEESIIHSPAEGNSTPLSEYLRSENLRKLRLIKKVLGRTTHLFFLSGREEWNMNMARSVLNEVRTLSLTKDVFFHIRTTSGELEEIFYEGLPELSSHLKIRLVNPSDIAARQLVSAYHPVDWIGKATERAVATTDFHVLIVGFGDTGSKVLRKLTEYGQFVGSAFRATVVDKDPAAKTGRFETRFPGMLSNYAIEFIEADAGKADFFSLIRNSVNVLDYIVVTLGNDDLNIRTAVSIRHLLLASAAKPVRLLVQVRDNHSYKRLFELPVPAAIEIFGREKDMFTERIIVRGSLEATARKIHHYYQSKKKESRSTLSWDEVSETERLSNISAAEHIHAKLALAGLTAREVGGFKTREDFAEHLGRERLENLAKGEHLRWNALYFTNGWTTWSLKDIPDDSVSNKDQTRKLHACLVDWVDLSRVKDRFNEDYHQYDYENVLSIFDLTKDGIYDEP